VINSGVNQSIPTIRLDTPSLFKKTEPEFIQQDQATGTYNLQSAISFSLVYLIKSEFARDLNATNWEVELRDHIKGMNLK